MHLRVPSPANTLACVSLVQVPLVYLVVGFDFLRHLSQQPWLFWISFLDQAALKLTEIPLPLPSLTILS